ncbi:putative F-box protein At1g67623 [Cicer arietinum]|uniref:F-box protein At1g67623 n=1 Tax=Cicer arietinum TaxID=3827 RepID=A0A1S2YR74_CICAR|nr:putative F-box protein At1g67623 [Cicer arietinum]
MASRMLLKREISKKRHAPSSLTSIESLPRDLLLEVVTNVASQSFIDLHNMKMCCKDFLEVTEDKHVLQNISLDNFPLIQWFLNERALSFLKRCMECENIESLFREGLREYFRYPNGNIDGLENLKKASQKGHKEAKYVYGMILLCSEDYESRKEGFEHMRYLRKFKCIMSSRKKVQYLTSFLWKNNGMLVRNQTPLCNSKSTCKGWRVKKGRWLLLDDDDDDIGLCEYCRWDHELEFFYKLFNVH